jgi:acyl transferase domain-containing protein
MENVANTDTGVYMASSSAEYLSHLLKDTDNISMYQPTGSLPSILSNRISYFFNMKGPSMTVDTGCSASLVALHVACQSLARKESKIVLVGGAHILLGPEFFISMGMAG